MKRIFLVRRFFLSLLLAFPMIASADIVEIDGVYYNLITKGKAAEVTNSPSKYTGRVVIPSYVTYDGEEYSVTAIESSAFSGCSDLTYLYIPGSVLRIGNEAFLGCSALTSLTIPNSITTIGKKTFYGCSGLTSMIIPNGVTRIGEEAFSGCSSLNSVTIPSSVKSISSTFLDCVSLTSVHISDIAAWCNITFGTSTDVWRYGNPLLRAHHLYLGDEEIKELVIPNNVKIITNTAFATCDGLTSVTISDSVSSIGSWAFFDCPFMKSVTIGSGIKKIEFQAFSYCTELSNVYCWAEKVPETSSYVFHESYIEYATLHVPAASVEAYKTAAPWKDFGSIVALNDEDIPVVPEPERCAVPTISYENWRLKFECETEGAQIVHEIKPIDLKNGTDGIVDLTPTYVITAYATCDGYQNSDVATATISWKYGRPVIIQGFSNVSLEETTFVCDVNGDGTVDVADIATIISEMAARAREQTEAER